MERVGRARVIPGVIGGLKGQPVVFAPSIPESAMNPRPLVALVFVLALPFAARPAAATLIAYWSFDGCTVTDASGHGQTLTSTNLPTCSTGRIAEDQKFDGATQYLERYDAAFTPGSNPRTVTVWERSTRTSGFQSMVGWYRCGANPLCHNGIDGADYILALENGHAYLETRDDVGNSIDLEDSTHTVADGNWHFVVLTMNTTTDSSKIYVDGQLRCFGTAPFGGLTSGSVSVPLEVGRHFRTGWGSPDYYFEGDLDEVRIYDEELTAAQIATLFQSGTTAVGDPSPPSRLVIERCWPNPVRGGRALVGFDLPSDAPADLEVFDLAGRRMASFDRLHGAGRHQVELGDGGALAPGVYLVRLTQGGATASRRLTVLE